MKESLSLITQQELRRWARAGQLTSSWYAGNISNNAFNSFVCLLKMWKPISKIDAHLSWAPGDGLVFGTLSCLLLHCTKIYDTGKIFRIMETSPNAISRRNRNLWSVPDQYQHQLLLCHTHHCVLTGIEKEMNTLEISTRENLHDLHLIMVSVLVQCWTRGYILSCDAK